MRINKTLLLVTCFMGSTVLTQASDSIPQPPKHQLGFNVGFQQYRECNLHSRVYSGFSSTFRYKRVWVESNPIEFGILFRNVNGKSKFEKDNSNSNLSLQFDITKKWNVVQNTKVAYFLGVGADLHYNLCYYPNWDESHLYWANRLNFSLDQQIVFQFGNNHHLTGKLNLPLLTILSRPDESRPHKMDDFSFQGLMSNLHRNPSVTFLGKVFQVNAQLIYEYPRSRKAQPLLMYDFSAAYLKSSESKSYQTIIHSIGLIWKF